MITKREYQRNEEKQLRRMNAKIKEKSIQAVLSRADVIIEVAKSHLNYQVY